MFTGIVREIGAVVSVDGGGRRPGTGRTRARNGRRLQQSATRSRSRVAASPRPPSRAASSRSTPSRRRSRGRRSGRSRRGTPSTSSRRSVPASRSAATTSRGTSTRVGEVRSVETEGDGRRVAVGASADVLRYCVEKGSMTVDGVSLTVASLAGEAFEVALVPHTLEATTLVRPRARPAREPRGRRLREVRGEAAGALRATIRAWRRT